MVEKPVVSALDDYSTPLGDADLSPVSRALTRDASGSQIVGLGEATHGTRECFAVKRQLVERLVEDHGYRTVAFECDFANTLALHSYVRDGEGTAASALEALQLWVWKTSEIRHLLDWLRAFNANRPPSDRVRVHGVSLSTPGNAATALEQLLPTDRSRLAAFAQRAIPDSESDQAAYFAEGIEVAEATRERLDEREPVVVEETSRDVFEVAQRLCRHIEQNCEWNQTRLETPGQFDPVAFEQRDEFMAENVGWCLDTEPGNGVVVWAHNTHTKRGRFDMAYDWATGQTMGAFLDDEFGGQYSPVGMDCARGEFRAIPDRSEANRREPTTFTLEEPVPSSLTSHLDELDAKRVFLDVESAASDERLASWVDSDRRLRGVSALVAAESGSRVYDIHTDIVEAFDSILFFENGTASVPLDI